LANDLHCSTVGGIHSLVNMWSRWSISLGRGHYEIYSCLSVDLPAAVFQNKVASYYPPRRMARNIHVINHRRCDEDFCHRTPNQPGLDKFAVSGVIWCETLNNRDVEGRHELGNRCFTTTARDGPVIKVGAIPPSAVCMVPNKNTVYELPGSRKL